MKERYDIVVVGGGPAGLSAAFTAARAGASVILYEKDDGIGHNIRTSGVTWIKEIEKLGIKKEYYNPIKNYSFISPLNEVKIRGSSFQSCVLDVRATYQYLASLASNSGASIMPRSQVFDVFMSSGRISGVRVKTVQGKKDVYCKLVIDASGFSSVVARKVGIAQSWIRYGIGAEYECFCDTIDAETWHLMVGQDYSDAGYAWVFPLSKNRVRIGVGIGRPESLTDPLEKLHQIMEKRLKPLDTLGRINPIELHRGFIPNQGPRQSTAFDGLLLVGDTAGQANPLVLEGIRYAIEFGRTAGEIGARSLNSNADRSSLLEYEKIWKSGAEAKLKSALKVQSKWIGLTDQQWARELEILKDMSAEEFLDFVKAEFTASKMIRLALNHPKLAARQLFNMVLGH